jgi:FKBP-type peptidyl-prolyl cis-trans isomerase
VKCRWTCALGAALALAPACGLFGVAPPEYAPARLADGLVVHDVVVPDAGPRAKPGDTLTRHNEGRISGGAVFDSSYDRGVPVTFVLGSGAVPAGLDRGLVGLRKLGRRKLLVPAELGYGAEGVPGLVPGGAALAFDVELLEIAPPGAR